MQKIPTLFERVFDNHKIVDILPNITQGCKDALKYGDATIKYDGSCCAIIDNIFYKRYDAKKGKAIPDNAIKCIDEPDSITGHLPCWVPCDRNNQSDKWFWRAYNNTVLTKNYNYKDMISEYCVNNKLEFSIKDRYLNPNYITYEAIGPHFQRNPYNLVDDMLIPHGINIVYLNRTFEGIKKYLTDHYIEGLVFWIPELGPICKIKRTDFGLEWNKSDR